MRINGNKWDGTRFEINLDRINILKNSIKSKAKREMEIDSTELSQNIEMMSYVEDLSSCNNWVFPDHNKTRFFIKKEDKGYALSVIPYPPNYTEDDKTEILNSCSTDDKSFFTNIFEAAKEAEADDNLVAGELHIILNAKEKNILDKEFEF